jgi:hypothetical protein
MDTNAGLCFMKRPAALAASHWTMNEKALAVRRRRAADGRRYRARLKRGAMMLSLEVDGSILSLAERFAGLPASKMEDRTAVAIAVRRLLEAALDALMRETARRR